MAFGEEPGGDAPPPPSDAPKPDKPAGRSDRKPTLKIVK